MLPNITLHVPEVAEEMQLEKLLNHSLDEPKMYKVILFNDEFTTFEFVIYVLMKFFHKSEDEAETITQNIHQNGQGIAGVFSYDEAETRKSQVLICARKHDFPLRCAVEKE